MQWRWDNMRAVVERIRVAGGIDVDVDDDALAHFSLTLSVGLAMLDPVISRKPSQLNWDALIARIGTAMAPPEMLLRAEHEPRSYWRILVDVPDRPGGVDMFIRAAGRPLRLHGRGVRRRPQRGDQDAGHAADRPQLGHGGDPAGGGDVSRQERARSPQDPPTTPWTCRPGSWTPAPSWSRTPAGPPTWPMQLVAADHVEVVSATKGQDDGPDVLRLQWTQERHVLLRRTWAPFTRVEQTRASALLRLSAAIAARGR